MSSFWPEEAELRAIPDDEPTPGADYLRHLDRIMRLVDRAMGEEGIPSRTRDRVVARVLHGTPTPDATPDWAEPVEPLPRDLAVVDGLANAASRTWTVPPANG